MNTNRKINMLYRHAQEQMQQAIDSAPSDVVNKDSVEEWSDKWTEKGPFLVTEYEVARRYGGPEEGGWWYDDYQLTGKPSQKVATFQEAEALRDELERKLGQQEDLSSSRGFENLPEDTEDDQIPLGFSGDASNIRYFIEKVRGNNASKGRPHYE